MDVKGRGREGGEGAPVKGTQQPQRQRQAAAGARHTAAAAAAAGGLQLELFDSTHPVGDGTRLQLVDEAQRGADLALGDPLILLCRGGQQGDECLERHVEPERAAASGGRGGRRLSAAPAARAARTRDGRLDAEERVVEVGQHLVLLQQSLGTKQGRGSGSARWQASTHRLLPASSPALSSPPLPPPLTQCECFMPCPVVSMHVVSPRACASMHMAATNSGCSSGSPPLMVMPP